MQTCELRYDPETGIIYRAGLAAGYKMNTGYIELRYKSKRYLAHRLAWFLMTGNWPRHQIDHINGDRADNRWCNLREVTNQQNAFNRPGVKGYTWVPRKRRWAARLQADHARISLGYFKTKEEARSAYLEAARKHYGEYSFASRIT